MGFPDRIERIVETARPPAQVWAALTTAASIGGDTDTVAAICGAVLGACHGVDGLPSDLLDTVVRVNRLDLAPVVDGLLDLRSLQS